MEVMTEGSSSSTAHPTSTTACVRPGACWSTSPAAGGAGAGRPAERGYRFSELRRRVSGVSEKMLAQTLQALERDGFVLREAYPVIPPRVDYSLTPLGLEAAEYVSALAHWVEARMCAVSDAREEYDGRATRA